MKKPILRFAVGQIWEMNATYGRKLRLYVERLTPDGFVGTTPKGHAIRITRRRLVYRAGKLVRNANGSTPPQHGGRRRAPTPERIETRTASDVKKTAPMKGTLVATGFDRKILALKAEGLSATVIGARMGLSKSQVRRRIERAREAIADQANIAAMAAT